MPDSELNDLLTKLALELKNIKSVDKSSKKLLNQLKNDIDILLKNDDIKVTSSHLSLLESLKESTEHFEASHPELTAKMNNVINFLNNLGL